MFQLADMFGKAFDMQNLAFAIETGFGLQRPRIGALRQQIISQTPVAKYHRHIQWRKTKLTALVEIDAVFNQDPGSIHITPATHAMQRVITKSIRIVDRMKIHLAKIWSVLHTTQEILDLIVHRPISSLPY